MYVFRLLILLLMLTGFAWAGCPADSLRQNAPRVSTPSVPADPWLGVDKGLHFVGSLMATVAVSKSMQRFAAYPASRSVAYGFGVSMSLGTVKEIWDSRRPGHFFSIRDLTADLAGSMLGAYLSKLK